MLRAKECKDRLQFAPMATPGAEVKQAREAIGLSQAALAAATGVDPTTVRRIERGVSKEPTKLGVLQSYLGIGPYASRAERVDLTRLTNQDLIKHLEHVIAELADRLPEEPRRGSRPAPRHAMDAPDARTPVRAGDERKNGLSPTGERDYLNAQTG